MQIVDGSLFGAHILCLFIILSSMQFKFVHLLDTRFLEYLQHFGSTFTFCIILSALSVLEVNLGLYKWYIEHHMLFFFVSATIWKRSMALRHWPPVMTVVHWCHQILDSLGWTEHCWSQIYSAQPRFPNSSIPVKLHVQHLSWNLRVFRHSYQMSCSLKLSHFKDRNDISSALDSVVANYSIYSSKNFVLIS